MARTKVRVRLTWVPPDEGGRKTMHPGGSYFPVSRFSDEADWPANTWSVRLELESPLHENGVPVSYGVCQFLVEQAPHEKLLTFSRFEVYEGPNKVANVEVLGPG